MIIITFKKLSEIAEVFNGVREIRYEKGHTVSQEVYQVNRQDNKLSKIEMELSEDISKKYYSKKGDIIINLMHPFDIFLIEEEGIIINSRFAIIRLNKEYDADYVFQVLKNKKHIFSRVSDGNILRFLKVKDLKDIKIKLPDFNKQEKEGILLNLINEKIKCQKRIIKQEEKFIKSIIGEANVKL